MFSTPEKRFYGIFTVLSFWCLSWIGIKVENMLGNEDNFYLFLPSNASLDFYPTATLSSFQVKLPVLLHLKGNYEVGLKELHFPHRFRLDSDIHLKVPDDELAMLLYDKNTLIPYPDHHMVVSASSGRTYPTLDLLMQYINQEIDQKRHHSLSSDAFMTNKNNKLPKLSYDDSSGRYIVMNDLSSDIYCKLNFSASLGEKFGFSKDQFRLDAQVAEPIVYAEHYKKKSVKSVDYIYVYSDLIQRSIVGNTLAPLLRIVDVKPDVGAIQSTVFEDPIYFKLLKTSFDSIEILLRDDRGKPIPFESNQGKVVAVLHFRRV
jgi:hypothetical protein